jgi:hypothetical protein
MESKGAPFDAGYREKVTFFILTVVGLQVVEIFPLQKTLHRSNIVIQEHIEFSSAEVLFEGALFE